MKLVLFSPTNVKSAIARMAALITRELLAGGHKVTLIRTETKKLLATSSHEFGTRILPWNDDADVRAVIRQADACIYQIGDNFEFHEGGVRWLEEVPGLVCLHDFFLGHLFLGWATARRPQAEAILGNWYGWQNAELYFRFSDGPSFIEGTRETMPMTEWICHQATGVITHSKWGCDRVLKSCAGPVRVVPLAYDAPAARRIRDERGMANTGPLKLLTLGHVNPNKRIESIIQAVGLDPMLKEDIHYRIVGAVEPAVKSSIEALAASFGVKLMISGEVSQQELQHAILDSDVISCLRWPALEAASASAIEAMLYGKALIVTNTGFYTELPDSYALKINPDNEVPEIQSALLTLLSDRTRVANLGSAAREWASKTFTARNYADQMVAGVLDTLKTAQTQNAIGYFCEILKGWSYRENPHVMDELIRPLKIFE